MIIRFWLKVDHLFPIFFFQRPCVLSNMYIMVKAPGLFCTYQSYSSTTGTWNNLISKYWNSLWNENPRTYLFLKCLGFFFIIVGRVSWIRSTMSVIKQTWICIRIILLIEIRNVIKFAPFITYYTEYNKRCDIGPPLNW